MRTAIVAATLAVIGIAIGVEASDRIGVYAVVDRVVFEPAGAAPERVQIWGAFAVATPNDRDLYQPVQRGYLYFTTTESKDLTRAEWNDLKSLAATKRIVAFSARFGQSVRVRGDEEKPQAPDRYTLGVGIQTIRSDRDYAPIRELSAHITR
jgi:hypothetical protein